MQDSYLKDIKILISSVITAFRLPVSGCASSMDQVESKQSIWPEYSACTNYEIYDYSLEASIQQAARANGFEMYRNNYQWQIIQNKSSRALIQSSRSDNVEDKTLQVTTEYGDMSFVIRREADSDWKLFQILEDSQSAITGLNWEDLFLEFLFGDQYNKVNISEFEQSRDFENEWISKPLMTSDKPMNFALIISGCGNIEAVQLQSDHAIVWSSSIREIKNGEAIMDDLELLVKEIKEGNIEPGSPIDHIR